MFLCKGACLFVRVCVCARKRERERERERERKREREREREEKKDRERERKRKRKREKERESIDVSEKVICVCVCVRVCVVCVCVCHPRLVSSVAVIVELHFRPVRPAKSVPEGQAGGMLELLCAYYEINSKSQIFTVGNENLLVHPCSEGSVSYNSAEWMRELRNCATWRPSRLEAGTSYLR